MSLNSPSPPNPQQTAQQQQQLNTQTAITQAEMNDVNQTTPYGSVSYAQTGTRPDGTPIYSATTALNAPEQKLFNTEVGTQNKIGQEARTLASNLAPMLEHAPNLSNANLTNTMMNWQQQYMQPIFNQQQSNLNAQLASEGIGQGSTAYDNAQNLQARNVNNAYENAMASDEGQAFNQAATAYQLPVQTLGTLLGAAQPASVNQSTVQTPQEQIQPANEEALVQQDYQSQLQNYQNSMSGIFGVGSALAGGWARAGFPV